MRSRLLPVLTTLALALGTLTGLALTAAAPASAAAVVLPVPTSAAGLGRIVTAPNGTIWFAEKDVNKVGMIQNGQVVKEIAFPARSPGITRIKDIDVAPDNSLWVLYESGEMVARVAPDGTIAQSGTVGKFGQQIRVAPDGAVWITVSFDEQYVRVVRNGTISDLPNSPECEDALGEAADGSMWCRTSSGLTRLNPAGGGTTYPANNYAAYPYAIAGGPVGSIWFGRYFSGTFATSPDDGEVGYLDAATSAVTAFNTGERTAPADLVRGPDNAMWFASVGAAKGIGHVDAAGRGALTQVGGYAPTSLTFGTDGAVWFTDAANNVIVRVPTSDLQTTNVDPGAGSVFSVGQQAGARAVPVKIKGKNVKIRSGRAPFTLACAKGTAGGCRGKVTLATAKAVKKPGSGKKSPAKVYKLTSSVKVKLKAGKKGVVRPKLTKTGNRLVKRGGATKAVVLVNGTPVGTVKLRR